jgi:putative peptide-modifying radical SAM enzyme
MYFHIILTEKCNSQCKYCYEKSLKEFNNGLSWDFEFDVPCNFNISVNKLKSFIKQDKNPKIIFYGGEPLLCVKKIIEIMNNIDAKFYMQTNGKLLDKIPFKYLNKFSKILISIDGNKKTTDFNRGKGTYEKILNNIKKIREKGFDGEIIARMTISNSDLFKQVKHLLNTGVFDSIHWQIDAGFYKNDFNEEKFIEFSKKYNKEILRLIDYWIENMKKAKVLKLYPFLGIFERLFYNKGSGLHCGAGFKNYTITTNGKITACPIMNNVKNFYCGDLNSKLGDLKKINIKEPCCSCDYLKICGGRCLYSNYAKLWGEKGEKLICNLIIFLIKSLKSKLPDIKELIEKNIIKECDFSYEKYFGPEIIP